MIIPVYFIWVFQFCFFSIFWNYFVHSNLKRYVNLLQTFPKFALRNFYLKLFNFFTSHLKYIWLFWYKKILNWTLVVSKIWMIENVIHWKLGEILQFTYLSEKTWIFKSAFSENFMMRNSVGCKMLFKVYEKTIKT